MDYKIYYIEDLESESRKSDLVGLGFIVEQYDPQRDINKVIDRINSFNPDIIIIDYRLNNGAENVYYDAPTIASTLRNRHNENFKEIPIILISNEGKIADFYKDFLNQDLFDYSIEKQDLSEKKEYFRLKILSFINSYSIIKDKEFNIYRILGLEENEHYLLHNLIVKKLAPKFGQIYEYSRFINDNLIHAIGPLIGEDVLAARLGIEKSSKDWNKILGYLETCEYNGVLSDTKKKWWAQKVEQWWLDNFGNNNLRRLNAEDRVKILQEKFMVDVLPYLLKGLSKSSKFWTICKGTSLPLDPFDGILLIKKDYKPWQEKEYYSKDYALSKIEKVKDFIDDVDLKYLKELAKSL